MDQAISNINVRDYKDEIVLVKYGGNAMLNDELKQSVVEDIAFLKKQGVKPVLVHGGGPFIQNMLDKTGVSSEFINGHRKTTPEVFTVVEMVLKGQVNSEIVGLINKTGVKAVGISGKDGKMAVAEKRINKDANGMVIDLGMVGNIKTMNTEIVDVLLTNGYIPVIASIASGANGENYNVNADMFAGALAGALQAKAYIAMTNVNGIMTDPEDQNSVIRKIRIRDIDRYERHIKGGMMPKIESCTQALQNGVESARIINGTIKHAVLKDLSSNESIGTIITK
jgi:acetylglutamate kinase